jgi:hypothetical protein
MGLIISNAIGLGTLATAELITALGDVEVSRRLIPVVTSLRVVMW